MDMITLAMAKAYTDSKGGYVEKKVNFTTATVPFMESPYPGIYASEPIFNLADATPGDILTVVWDGTEYKAEVGMAATGYNAIGNPAFEGGEDNGLPLSITSWFEGDVFVGWIALTFDNSASHTIAIYQETIHPIDPKYLPGVCLPVVELSTVFANGAGYTAEENAKLKAAWENDSPIVVKCGITVGNGGWNYSSAVWYKAFNDYGNMKLRAFVFPLGTETLLIGSMTDGETWSCMVD